MSYSKWYIEIIGKIDYKIINISIFIYQSHSNKLRYFLFIVEFSVWALNVHIYLNLPSRFYKNPFFISAWGTIIQKLSQDINILLQNRNKCDILCDRNSSRRAIKCKFVGEKVWRKRELPWSTFLACIIMPRLSLPILISWDTTNIINWKDMIKSKTVVVIHKSFCCMKEYPPNSIWQLSKRTNFSIIEIYF